MADEYAGLKSNFKGEGWTLLGVIRIAGVVLVSPPIIFCQILMLKTSKNNWWHFAGLWHRTVCRILGIKISVSDRIRHEGPVLYAVNHISWLDIIVLGGLLDGASFVAKSEMANWGLIGKLCNLHKTIFVNRARRSESALQRDALASRVAEGDSLILFPEGTSTDGVHVDTFKSALFSVAERADEASDHMLMIQPVTIAYTETNGMPLIRSKKPMVAWLGDVELFTHLRQFLGLYRTSVTLEFHPAVSLAEAGSRKALAQYCEKHVRAGLERAHRLEVHHGPQANVALMVQNEQQA